MYVCSSLFFFFFFFFTHPSTTEFYTLSLHDALPISFRIVVSPLNVRSMKRFSTIFADSTRSSALSTTSIAPSNSPWRSEEHTSELQSHSDLVCRLLLEKKKNTTQTTIYVR